MKNLSYDSSTESVQEFFSNAVEVRMPMKEDGSGHRGYGHILINLCRLGMYGAGDDALFQDGTEIILLNMKSDGALFFG